MVFNRGDHHTQARAYLGNGCGFIADFDNDEDNNEAIARLCAAWNACEGIPTGALEAGAKKDPTYWRMASVRNAIDRNIAQEERDALREENAALRAENERLKQQINELGNQP